jgi:two-component system sensor histidine kinase YesM
MLKSASIRQKLLFTFVPLTLIPLGILMLVSFWFYSNQMKNETGQFILQTLLQVNRHVDTYLEELDRLTMIPYYNSDVLNIMADKNRGSVLDLYKDAKLVEGVLSGSMVNPREDLQGVFLYSGDGQLFFNARYNVRLNPDYQWDRSYWYTKALEADGKAVFLGRNADRRTLNPPAYPFSIARVIKPMNGSVIGAILIDANFDGLENIFSSTSLGEHANLVVLDKDNRIIYSKNERYLDALSKIRPNEKLQTITLDQRDYLTAYNTSALTGWKIVSLIPSTDLNRGITALRQTIILLSALTLLAVGFAAIYISHGITKPLRKLKRMMKEVQRGKYNVSMKDLSGDEIGDVARAFNKMSQEIDDLINQVLEGRFKQKEAELNHLKMQVRPHFLYNTLESIRALAELKDNIEVVEMTSALGSMLRYSIKEHGSFVRIEDEITQIKNYLIIQQHRWGDRFTVELDLEAEVLRSLTIPLILQPIVENAVQHGLSTLLNGGGFLRISGKLCEGGICIDVHDNGQGIARDRLRQLNASFTNGGGGSSGVAAASDSGSGIGLINVDSRIRLTFGEAYGVHLKSEEDRGTTVHLKLPHIHAQ